MLFAHGNAGNLTHRADIARRAGQRLGASRADLRLSRLRPQRGPAVEAGVLADARAARRWLAERAGIAESQIVLMGESLGGAVAVDLAAHDGARAWCWKTRSARCPTWRAYHYPWLPVPLVMRTQLDSAAKIRDYHGPLLQFHGDADTIVPFKLGQRLFDAANEPKRLVVIPGGDHNDPRTSELLSRRSTSFSASCAPEPATVARSAGSRSRRALEHQRASVTTTMIEPTIILASVPSTRPTKAALPISQAGVEVATFPAFAENRADQRAQPAKHDRGHQRSDDRESARRRTGRRCRRRSNRRAPTAAPRRLPPALVTPSAAAANSTTSPSTAKHDQRDHRVQADRRAAVGRNPPGVDAPRRPRSASCPAGRPIATASRRPRPAPAAMRARMFIDASRRSKCVCSSASTRRRILSLPGRQ